MVCCQVLIFCFLKIIWNFYVILFHNLQGIPSVLLQITVILLKDEEAYSLSLIIKSSVGGLLVLDRDYSHPSQGQFPCAHKGSGVGQNSA